MRYCFDLDGTLCTLEVDGMTEGLKKDHLQYDNAKPIPENIQHVNELFDDGHYIIIETARGTISKKDWFPETERQLKEWGVKYHELRTGVKIAADIYIDDKARNAHDYFKTGDY